MGRIFVVLIAAIIVSLVLLLMNQNSGMTFGLANDKFASLVSLSLIAVYLSLNALRPGAFGAGTVRNIAMWLFVFVALIAGYQNRNAVQDFASMITAGLIPARPQVSTGQDGTSIVVIGKSSNGHFEADANVNGKTIRFLIDTGASGIALSAQDAEKIGIDLADLAYIIPISTANGQALAAPTRIDELSVGTIVRRNMRALVVKEGALDQSLLGMVFLNSLSSFTVKQDELQLSN
jgi:aspartyl protease family protein